MKSDNTITDTVEDINKKKFAKHIEFSSTFLFKRHMFHINFTLQILHFDPKKKINREN